MDSPSINDANSAPDSVGATFVREFAERGLIDFAECSAFYETLDPEALCEEMAFLMSPEIRAIPFGLTGRRYYALCESMIQCAANWRQMTNDYRAKMMNLCMDFLEYNYRRTAPTSRANLVSAVGGTLEYIRTYALYPTVADIITESKRDNASPLEEGVVGATMERKRS